MCKLNWSDIADAFYILGDRLDAELLPGFEGAWVETQPTPSFSPLVWNRHTAPDQTSLDILESYFAANGEMWNRPEVDAYICLSSDSSGRMPPSCQALTRQGWHMETEPLSVIVLPTLGTAASRAGPWRCQIEEFDNRIGLPPEFVSLVKQGFDINDFAVSRIAQSYADARGSTSIVILRSEDGTVVCTGGVSIFRSWAFLSWGTVSLNYRRRGLIRLLTTISRKWAANRGVSNCALTTRTNAVRMLGKSAAFLYIGRKTVVSHRKDTSTWTRQ